VQGQYIYSTQDPNVPDAQAASGPGQQGHALDAPAQYAQNASGDKYLSPC
jgi:hypothetical protein